MTAAKNVCAVPWLACRIAAHICALPVAGVIETMRPLPLEAFPRAPTFVAGLAIIRGTPTPVVDMRTFMGETAAPAGRFVTARIGDRVVALAVDAVLGIHNLNPMHVTELPPLLKNVAGDTIAAVTSRDTELLLFFETARIFPPGFVETLMPEAGMTERAAV